MKVTVSKLGLSIVCLCVWTQSAMAQNTSNQWRWELGFRAGVLLAGKEVGRGINATAGRREQLIARLDHGGSISLQFGVHSAVLGLEANLLSGTKLITVKNEFGVDFPNHGERPVIYSGDILLYPFGRRLAGGRFRPYLMAGGGGAQIAVDLDNINNKENYHRLALNAGGGLKLLFGQEQRYCFDIRFSTHHITGKSPIATFDLQSVSGGFGVRF
jgi:hypothetical protein